MNYITGYVLSIIVFYALLLAFLKKNREKWNMNYPMDYVAWIALIVSIGWPILVIWLFVKLTLFRIGMWLDK